MLDLKSDKSIILGLGDLKLSDTEYTLNQDKMINGIHYKPIFPVYAMFNENATFYERYDNLLKNLVVGSGKGGTEISKGENTLFYGYAANRLSSNASNIVLGVLNTEYSYFLKEWFDPCTIYDEEPELSGRGIIKITHWRRKRAKYELFRTFNIYSKNLQISKEAFDYWEILEPKIVDFQNAFCEEQLNQLRLIRKR